MGAARFELATFPLSEREKTTQKRPENPYGIGVLSVPIAGRNTEQHRKQRKDESAYISVAFGQFNVC